MVPAFFQLRKACFNPMEKAPILHMELLPVLNPLLPTHGLAFSSVLPF
jgi:hypothetical protein